MAELDGIRFISGKVGSLDRGGPAEDDGMTAGCGGNRESVRALLKLSGFIDAINTRIGKAMSWLVIAAVLVSAVNATVRKVFDISSNSWLELQWVLFSVVFLLCSPWTLLCNAHIRIDIVNAMLPQRLRNVIDVIGHAFFLLPLACVMVLTGVPFFLNSYAQNEQSPNAGGLPQWPAKGLIMIAFTLLFFQGLSELVKRIAVMRGLIPDPHAGQKTSLESEAEELINATDQR